VSGVVHRGDGARPQVALTYDDGPGRGSPGILELLAERGARATFFMVGSEVERDPDLARAVLAAGHEIGSHSMRHLDHEAVPPAEAVDDMLDGARAIERALGLEPRLYRAPYGHFVPATVAEAERRGWTCVHWSALGMDWLDDATPRSVADNVIRDLEPGAIVLLHDSRRAKPMRPEPVVGGTALLLDELSRRGLRAVPIREMLEPA
jgi:peptidoglycan/xylan/chitin deacetylase (PgdA/CDA1 family)